MRRYRLIAFVGVSLLVHAIVLQLRLPIHPPADPPAPGAAYDVALVPLRSIPPAPISATSPPHPLPHSATQRAIVPAGHPSTGGPLPSAKSPPADLPVPSKAFDLTMRRPSQPSLDVRSEDLAVALESDSQAEASRVRPSGTPKKRGERTAAAIKARLDRLWRTETALRNVENGVVHPVVTQIGRDAERHFMPTWSQFADDRLHFGRVAKEVGRFVHMLATKYLEALEARAKSRHDTNNEDPTMVEQYDAMRRVVFDTADGLSCVVCATLGPNAAPELEVTQSSHRRPLDEMASRALRRAMALREGIPKKVRKVRACYRFSVHLSRVPPLPLVGCSFDESTWSAECFYPLKRIFRSRVHLISADYLEPSRLGNASTS